MTIFMLTLAQCPPAKSPPSYVDQRGMLPWSVAVTTTNDSTLLSHTWGPRHTRVSELSAYSFVTCCFKAEMLLEPVKEVHPEAPGQRRE